MSFTEGDFVIIKAFQRSGKVLRKSGQDTYEVQVGSLQLKCREQDLVPAPERKVEKPFSTRTQYFTPPNIKKEDEEVDLHGCTVEVALRLLSEKIDRVQHTGGSRIKIVHGLGQGKLHRGIHHYLSTLSYVNHFFLDTANAGVTWVYLK